MKTEFSPKVMALFLAALVALAPFSIDTYLPAMPAMTDYFGTTMGIVEMTIGAFFLGYACGQLIGGPLSDHYGRKRVGGPGVVIFLLATVVIIVAPTIEMVIAGRFFQALGGGFVTVIAPSVVRDRYTGKEAARMFALISVVMLLAPLVAPAVGSFLLKFADWRMIFVFLAGYALVSLVIIFFCLPERKIALTGKLNMAQVWAGYRRVLSHKKAMGYLVTQTFAVGVMFLFITGAAFAYISYLGVSTVQFPLFFGANVVTMMLFNRLNPLLLNMFSPHQLIGAGVTIQLLATIALWGSQIIGLPLIDPENLYMVVPMIMVAIGATGLVGPNCFACFLEDFEDNSGSASAILGTSVFVMGAILSAILGFLHSETILPMTSMMLISSLISVLSFRLLAGKD